MTTYHEPLEFGLATHRFGDLTVITVSGELDMATAPQLESAARAALRAGPVELDLASMSFCDSTGLRMLLAVTEYARGHKVDFTMRNPSLEVSRTIWVSGLAPALPVVASAAPGIAQVAYSLTVHKPVPGGMIARVGTRLSTTPPPVTATWTAGGVDFTAFTDLHALEERVLDALDLVFGEAAWHEYLAPVT